MNEQIQRNPDGTFPKGVSGNPKGRNTRAKETAILAIGQEIVTLQTWRGVFNKAALDALGKTVFNGEVVNDSNSTAQGRNVARTFLRDTLVGKPTNYISADFADSAFEQLAAYSDDDIAAAIAAIEQERQDGDDTGDPANGISAAG